MRRTAKLLIIAGSDSGGGAGIQADLKTASALGVYGATAITAVTAQNTRGVQSIAPVPPAVVAGQIRAVLEDIAIDAVKIGMLGDAETVTAVAAALEGFHGPVVLDPVMVAKSGDPLLDGPALVALRHLLLPQCTLLTPNLPEAARLLDQPEATDTVMAEAQGQALRAAGACAVLMKGGHAAGAVCTDLLVTPAGVQRFEAPRRATANTHGTGCSLASAIASELAKGRDLEAAVARAHGWLQGAIAAADGLQVGRGQGPVHHFHEIWA